MDRCVIAEGFYESEVLEAVRSYLGYGAVLWVVGANFGLHAVTAKLLYPATTVVAFEHSHAIAAHLLENAALNSAPVELHTYALSAGIAARPLFANSSGNPRMSTLYPIDTSNFDHRLIVATQRAADIIERRSAPASTVLIVDADGAKSDVLAGFARHLASPALRTIVFETANDFIETAQPAELHRLLCDAGIRLHRLSRRENTVHGLSNFAALRA